MAAVGNDGEVHEKIREGLADGRAAAPKADKADIIARNKAALAARKQAIDDAKKAENSKELPEGWKRVESRSRPGEFVYENIHTEERQSWFPDAVAKEEVGTNLAPMSAAESAREALKKKNAAALERRKAEAKAKKDKESALELPSGWIRSESKSRPGEVVYENTVTGERQAWFPDQAAGDPKQDLKSKNAAALEKRKAALQNKKSEDAGKALPAGWKRVESRSRPGEFVYENEFTDERQAWFPESPASKPLPEGWRKVESRTYPGEFVYENVHTLERQAWEPTENAPLTENQVAMPSAEQLKKPDAEKPNNIIGTAKALYDYTATNREEEIDMIEGDVIQIEYRAGNGWWVGINTRTNRNGIFPGTYVEEM